MMAAPYVWPRGRPRNLDPVPVGAAAARELGRIAERLVPVACELAGRVHDEGREAIAEVLAGRGVHELQALAVVLAAMVPADKPASELLAWVDFDEHGRPLSPPAATPPRQRRPHRPPLPCGTRAAYERHRRHGETPCEKCRQAKRDHDRQAPKRGAAA